MWKPLIDLLVAIGVAFFKEWRARKDVQIIERQKFALEAAERAAAALAVKAHNRADAARLRDSGGTIELSSDDPSAGGGPPTGPVPP